jgi:hypothetical protein
MTEREFQPHDLIHFESGKPAVMANRCDDGKYILVTYQPLEGYMADRAIYADGKWKIIEEQGGCSAEHGPWEDFARQLQGIELKPFTQFPWKPPFLGQPVRGQKKTGYGLGRISKRSLFTRRSMTTRR